MPGAPKTPSGNANASQQHAGVKAPLIGSPAKSKSSTPAGMHAAKETVKLPSIRASPASPSKQATKNGKVSTPTSPTEIKSPANAMRHRASEAVKASSETPNASLELNGGSIAPLVVVTEATPEQAHIEYSSSPELAEPTQAAEATAQAAAAEAAANAEAERIRKENGNGMVQLIYEQYDELFPIADGSTTQAAIDEAYCLSFVMPNCLVHLSIHANAERFDRENSGIYDSLVHEEPHGVYHGLVKDQIYYVVVEQEEGQLKRDQEATKAKWAPAVKSDKQKKDDGRGFESCSCIYGNPCVDEYGCKDWHARFAIATANGWKGF